MCKFRNLIIFNFRLLILLSTFFTSVAFGQNNIFSKYNFPINQSDIINCAPDSIKILSISDTNIFLDDVRNCVNIKTLVLSRTNISSIPLYFKKFENLEEIVLVDIKTVPTNIDYIPNIISLKLVYVSDLKFPDTFFDSLSLKFVTINSCNNLYINNISCDELSFYHVNYNWNRSTAFKFKSKKVDLGDSNFSLTTRWLKNIYLEEIVISHCKNVRLTNSFFIRFPKLKKLEMEL